MTPEVLQITDHNFMDILAQGKKEFPLQYYVDEFEKYPGRMIPLHWHPEIEFYVVSGCTLQIQLGQTTITLGEGDGLFINSNVLHSFSPIDSGKSACPNIVFSHELLAPYGSIIYQKYMQDILKDEALSLEILDISGHYAFNDEDVKKELQQLYANLAKFHIDGQRFVVDHIKRPLQQYAECYNLKGVTSRIRKAIEK